jgi:hypothetical protein
VIYFNEIPASKFSLARRKAIYGIGINDASYLVCPIINGKKIRCPYYTVWSQMIERCYSDGYKDKNPTYKKCSVAKDWHLFSSFKDWMMTQNWIGKQLDKDILVAGNKMYSSESCLFVSSQINTLLIDCGSKRGKCPQGVNLIKTSGMYRAACSVSGTKKYLGHFKTAELAESRYLSFKSELIRKNAYDKECLSNPRLKAALLKIASNMSVISNQLKHK